MSLWNQEKKAYVIWFAVIGWAGGSLVAVVGSRVKTICLEWYGVSEWRVRALHLFCTQPNDAFMLKADALALICDHAVRILYTCTEEPGKHPRLQQRRSRFWSVSYMSTANTQNSGKIKWWLTIIYSIAPKLGEIVYPDYSRKVFKTAVIRWQATKFC